jgi:hypothetical protein
VGDELVQLAAMPNALRTAERTGDRHVANACLESMLLHARNLMEFLIEPYWSTDIHRSDFALEWSPPSSPVKERLLDARPNFDRYLTHLAWDRLDGEAYDLDSERIAYDLVEVMGAFVKRLRDDGNHAAEWFDAYLLQARRLLEQRPVADQELGAVSSERARVTTTEPPDLPGADLPGGPATTVARHVQSALGFAFGLVAGVVDDGLRRATSIPRRILTAAASRRSADD